MARMMMMMMFMVVALVVAAPAAYAASYTVGDSSGWVNTGISYSNWVGSKTFTVGDTLVFNYRLNHAVDQVSATDYESCSSASPIKSYSGGTTTVTLSTAGSWYFICPTPGHCASGQALSITVTDDKTIPSPPGSTTASPPPPTTKTIISPPPPSTATSSPPPPAGKAGGLVVSGLSSLVCVLVIFLMSVSL